MGISLAGMALFHSLSSPMRDFQRRKATRPTHDRILIVCEGTKTEPKYLTDLVRSLKLSTTYIKVTPSLSGSGPKKVLEHALKLF